MSLSGIDLPSFDIDLIKNKPNENQSKMPDERIKKQEEPDKRETLRKKPEEQNLKKQGGGSGNTQATQPVTDNNSGYRKSTTIDPQKGGSSGSGTQSDTKADENKSEDLSNKRRIRNKCKSPTVQLKDVPRTVIDYVDKHIYGATNRQDALAAYIYIQSGGAVEVPDHVREIAQHTDMSANDGILTTIENMGSDINAINRRLLELEKMMERIEFMMVAILADNRAYTNNLDKQKSPRDAEFALGVMDDLHQRIIEQNNELKMVQNRREHSSVNYYRNNK